MPKGEIAIVFDCGATNVRVVAINMSGDILASESCPNNTRPDPFYPGGKIWDVNEIWDKLCKACRNVISKIDKNSVAGLTVTTFGVDGTIFSGDGKMLYPVISWQCERTVQVMASIGRYIPVEDLYAETGVLPFNFNTINKLIWLNENIPELVDKSAVFLFMPSVFSYFLTGEMVNDMTMAGTSMVTSLAGRSYSPRILEKTGFPLHKMGKPVEPGTITGKITRAASALTGLPEGIPVVATGHDTQFAVFGSGAGVNQPVLSSGTWEILMVRSNRYRAGREQLDTGITTELDSQPGLYNIGNQWIASGILEWARKTLYPDITDNVYDFMIEGASKVPPGSNGITVKPGFYEELKGKPGGEISGLTMDSTRDEIYRAMLEALCLRLKQGKEALENAGGFRAESLICVGGGSKNRLWNQMRANFAGVPVKVTDRAETTVLGASMFVQYACGNASSPDEARSAVEYVDEIYNPE
ncbi:MAG TPA: L-fuculokinase [Bacteroidales bacterium]|nr:L-fuculokinase [Bacteroidales bacterium]